MPSQAKTFSCRFGDIYLRPIPPGFDTRRTFDGVFFRPFSYLRELGVLGLGWVRVRPRRIKTEQKGREHSCTGGTDRTHTHAS